MHPLTMNFVHSLHLRLCRDPTGQHREAIVVDVYLLAATGSSLLVTVEEVPLTLWSLDHPTVIADQSLEYHQSLLYVYQNNILNIKLIF